MNKYGGVEFELHTLLALALDGRERLASRSSDLSSGKEATIASWIQG
jgi:hypothetical protein